MVASSVTQVQGSNDWSIASKLSMVNSGYFTDQTLKYFVSKTSRRSALIHRGYYVRAKAIDYLLQRFFSECVGTEKTAQVISLGAGFDSTFFRLTQSGKHQPQIFKFIELDFSEVVERKHNIVKANEELADCLKNGNYHLLSADLRDLKMLDRLLKNDSLIDLDAPTLFISECSITYMDEPSSSRLIDWCGQNFPNSVFAVYEQVEPRDGFGLVMQQHFTKLGIPLMSLPVYHNKALQKERYLQRSWSLCQVIDMNQFYYNVIPLDERQRINSLEPFDEFEGFHWKCAHYILLTAANGCGTSFVSKLWNFPTTEPGGTLQDAVAVTWDLTNCNLERYGHAGANRNGVLWISGGFGNRRNNGHGRLDNLVKICVESNLSEYKVETVLSDKRLSRMYHSMTCLPDKDSLIVYGGRFAPGKLPEEILLVDSGQNPVLRTLKVTTELRPRPRWRHASVAANINEHQGILTCGGRNDTEVFNDCWFLSFEGDAGSWRELPSLPVPLHSHSAVCSSHGRVIVTGGMGSAEEVHSTVYQIDLNEMKPSWNILELANPDNLLPRYSHNTVRLNDRQIALVGGVASLTKAWPGVALIDLERLACTEYALPEQNPDSPILLVSHSVVRTSEGSVLCIGGGSACFSFGTHLNTHTAKLSL